jgi:hypothetical protein
VESEVTEQSSVSRLNLGMRGRCYYVFRPSDFLNNPATVVVLNSRGRAASRGAKAATDLPPLRHAASSGGI